MRRRITTAIVGVTAFILVALGIPLAIVAQRSVLRSEVVELQATAAQTLTEIEVPIDPAQLADVRNEPDSPPPFAVYDATGELVFGDGPSRADATVRRALNGSTSTGTNDAIVVATPITDQGETLIGVLWLAEPLTGANSSVRRVWLIMAAAALVAIGCAWLIADRLGRRLASPIVDLAEAARRTAVGGVLVETEPSGIAEIDQLRDTLVTNSMRINDALARERRFSADVSHQLRTPITALRLKLEANQPTNGELEPSTAAELDRLEHTVEHLLAFARDAAPSRSTCTPSHLAHDAVVRWSEHATPLSRDVVESIETTTEADASAIAISQVLDVLLDNAIRHGHGTIAVTVRKVVGGIAVDVADDGAISDEVVADDPFERHRGSNHGIGLALARSIIEAEGGRLILASRSPTKFAIMMLDVNDDDLQATGVTA